MVPSKLLTLDLMETLDLFFRRAGYHQNASHRNMKETRVLEKLSICKVCFVDVLYSIHPTSPKSCKNRPKVSLICKFRGFHSVQNFHEHQVQSVRLVVFLWSEVK
jgi:hypothetical protein